MDFCISADTHQATAWEATARMATDLFEKIEQDREDGVPTPPHEEVETLLDALDRVMTTYKIMRLQRVETLLKAELLAQA